MRSPFLDAELLLPAAQSLVEEEKGVIGGEDRAAVADVLAVPFRWICSIAAVREITHASGRTSRTGLAPAGSGVLVSPRHVLTAAHVLHSVRRDSNGGVSERHRAQTVRMKFGRDGDATRLIEVEAESLKWPQKWNPESGSSVYDFALLTLKTPVGEQVFKAPGSQALGFWGATATASLGNLPTAVASRLLGARVFTAGYPHSSKGRMMCATGVLSTGLPANDAALNTRALIEQWARNGPMFSMTADATEGQSGSPVWIVDNGRRHIVGIAVTAGDRFNQVRAISPLVQRCIASWMAAPSAAGEIDEFAADEHVTPPNELEESEFHLDRLPPAVRGEFARGGAAWRDAVAKAIRAGAKSPRTLADLIFFMQHAERVTAGVGKPIAHDEPDFFKLRAEWKHCLTIAVNRLLPARAKAACAVFVGGEASSDYERGLAAPTTGRATLLISGRNGPGAGGDHDQMEAFDRMQETVESLGANDALYLAAWQFKPASVPLTKKRSGALQTWGDLLVRKAQEGVAIRIIMTDFPPEGLGFKSDIAQIDALVGQLSAAAADNLQYIVSMHPATLPDQRKGFAQVPVATHHQKLMVARKGTTVAAFCGGLDISPPRSADAWAAVGFIWHDVHAFLEGRIARDLEREFVWRWNREMHASTERRLPQWKTWRKLATTQLGRVDQEASRNPHKLQMVRTVSAGATPAGVRRDDIWQAYFRLIGCATAFLFLENQYFREPALASAIVRQTQAQPELIVIVVVSSESDDPRDNMLTKKGRALQQEFFRRLFAGIAPMRLRVYGMFGRLVHSKLILVDDRALSIGSANANPRGFFLDSELNVVLDDADAVRAFRQRLWAHDLGHSAAVVASWKVGDFTARWDAVAKANEALKPHAERMAGEGVFPFDPRDVKGDMNFIPDVLTELST